MRIILVIMGLLLTIVSIPAYLYSPHFLSQAIHSFIGPMTGGNTMGTSGMLRQMGYPSMSQVIPIIQYSTLGVTVAGIGLMLVGAVAKKIPKQNKTKLVAKEPDKIKEIPPEPHVSNEKMQANLPTLRILQERLAKGEITPNEFQNLKRYLE